MGIESVLYVSFIIGDMYVFEYSAYTAIIKYFSIILCFCFSIFNKEVIVDRSKYKIITWAIGFAVMADGFLLFSDCFIPGLGLFIAVQICYASFLNGKNGIKLIVKVIGGIGITTILLSVFCLQLIDFTIVLASIYFVCLVTNLVVAIRKIKQNVLIGHRNHVLFTIGLFLLLLCDIHVGVNNLGSYFELDKYNWLNSWVSFAQIAMWLFYLPSQILIMFSTRKLKK